MRSRFWLWIAAALLLTYVGYIVWAKFARTFGPPPVRLGEIGEFALFFSAILAFALQVIVEERRKTSAAGDQT